jgi:hypothetical protein
VRLAVPGHAEGKACSGCPPVERLFARYGSPKGSPYVRPRRGARNGISADQSRSPLISAKWITGALNAVIDHPSAVRWSHSQPRGARPV